MNYRSGYDIIKGMTKSFDVKKCFSEAVGLFIYDNFIGA
jgi:hypothetical protein